MDLIKRQKKTIEKLLEEKKNWNLNTAELARLRRKAEMFDDMEAGLRHRIEEETARAQLAEKAFESNIKLLEEERRLHEKVKLELGVMKSELTRLEGSLIDANRRNEKLNRIINETDTKSLEKTQRRLQERGQELETERHKVRNFEQQVKDLEAKIKYLESNAKLEQGAA